MYALTGIENLVTDWDFADHCRLSRECCAVVLGAME